MPANSDCYETKYLLCRIYITQEITQNNHPRPQGKKCLLVAKSFCAVLVTINPMFFVFSNIYFHLCGSNRAWVARQN